MVYTIIIWLVFAGMAILAMHYSALKEINTKYGDMRHIPGVNEAFEKIRNMKRIIKPSGYILCILLGPLMLLISLLIYQRNFTLYYKLPK